MTGSSPLTRGKPGGVLEDGLDAGLIPAHAGKTRLRSAPARGRPAHPRSRGENHAVERTGHAGQGSSPLTRGKPASRQTTSEVTGLIPAHAGKTKARLETAVRMGAHPRSRGENFACGAAIAKNVGSSPLTRGKPACGGRSQETRGLIPAHAGKTEVTDHAAPSGRAHPRSRGENSPLPYVVPRRQGSSPLTRGKPQARRGGTCNQRLIPAHAGKT